MLEITWLGHATFQFRLDTGEVFVMDPWTDGNPKYPTDHKFDRVDAILVSHGHFDVNGVRTNISSYIVRPGDVITVHPTSMKIRYFHEIRAYIEDRGQPLPEWLSLDVNGNGVTARVSRVPERRDIQLPLNEQLIVEYYSR